MCMSEKPRIKGVILKRISLGQGGGQICGYDMRIYSSLNNFAHYKLMNNKFNTFKMNNSTHVQILGAPPTAKYQAEIYHISLLFYRRDSLLRVRR